MTTEVSQDLNDKHRPERRTAHPQSEAARNPGTESRGTEDPKSKKELTCISGGMFVPSTRYRVDAVLPHLQERGWAAKSIYGYGPFDQRIVSRPLRKSYRIACRAKRAVLTAGLRTDGPVWVQRLAIPTWGFPEVSLARRNGRVVFDFDDAIFLDAKQRECQYRRKALNEVFHACRHVVAGNSWLASQVPDSCEVSVIPTCLDTDAYLPASEPPEDTSVVRIGWIGTSSNFRHLKQLVEPLRMLRDKFDNVEFCLCSDERDEHLLSQLNAKFVRWSADSEIATLQSFDIGIMPLAEEDWCRGKCSFKLIQYLAVGLASVSSPVGMNCEVVTEGVDGLFAHDGNWLEPLEALLADSNMRRRMGQEARKTAESRFSLRLAVDAYERIFSSLL